MTSYEVLYTTVNIVVTFFKNNIMSDSEDACVHK